MAAEAPSRILDRSFFERETAIVARDLLGVWLLRRTADGLAGGPIVETEAYGGPEDRASHARAGRTPRTTPMFGPAGHAYVYLVYGMHECLNVVAFRDRQAGAVLLRAIEPRVGMELMRARRGGRAEAASRLAAGPARLCQALAVTRELNGHDLLSGEGLWLAQPEETWKSAQGVVVGRRIGVDYATEGWADRQWRFTIAGHPSVSRPAR